MKIDFSRRPELVHGAVQIVSSPDGAFAFKRLSREMYGVIQDDPPNSIWDYMADCPSGVRIIFRTDASEAGLKLIYGKPLGASLYAGETDIAVDGGPFRTFRAPPFGGDGRGCEYAFLCPLGEKGREKTVEIWLSNQIPCRLASLELDTENEPRPVGRNGKILFIGDSITQGYFDSPAGCFAARYASSRGTDFVNAGIGGASLRQGIGKAAAEQEWDELFIAYGTNDSAWRKPEDFKRLMRDLLETAAARKGASVRVITPIPLLNADETRRNNLEALRRAIHEAAASFPQVTAVNGPEMIPADETYFADGCHPNAEGMKLYANNLIKALS